MDVDVHIKSIVKSSLIDYPGKVCCVVFLNKCNYRCPYCHNPELVFDEYSKEYPDITVEFMKMIKDLGYAVKLDTNGSNPEVIRQAIQNKVVDYIAMDIKNSPEKYDETTRVKVNIENINKSIRLIIDAGASGAIEYDFRTTILPRFHKKEDFEKMAKWLSGAKKYYLQQFKTEQSLVDDSLRDDKTYSLGELEDFRKIMQETIKEVELRT